MKSYQRSAVLLLFLVVLTTRATSNFCYQVLASPHQYASEAVLLCQLTEASSVVLQLSSTISDGLQRLSNPDAKFPTDGAKMSPEVMLSSAPSGKQEFARVEKRKDEYIRFGKRKDEYIRFGRK